MEKQISVIVPVYNVEKYLARCVESILRQEQVNLELILVDDGSTDGSAGICDSYASDPRVRVIHQENRGVSRARNVGMELAQGEYLYFVDSDDWLAEGAIGRMLHCGGGADLIMCGAYNAQQVGEGEYHLTKRLPWDRTEPYAVRDVYEEIFNKSVILWNKLIRRAIVGELRFQEQMTYGEDCDFVCRLLDHVHSAVIVPEELYYYFTNRQGSVVASRIDDRSLELLDNAMAAYDYLVPRGQAVFGIKRIQNTAWEVLLKIPVTVQSFRENRRYLRKIRQALAYPALKYRLQFYRDSRFSRSVRWSYFRFRNPFFAQERLLRRIVKNVLIGRKEK